ncbi:MAG TPA: HD domain-containing phosphohydrolase [Desulfuromonadaceae bacterium]
MSPEPLGTIFIVDDDRYVLDSIATLLREYGFIVIPFDNGHEAVRRFAAEPVDLVLTDINMPGMTGIELLEKIRFLDHETPVLLMTAYADLDTAVLAIQKGAFDFIIKPYRPPYLIHAIEKGINYKRLTRIEKNYKRELEQTVEQRTAELYEALGKLTSMSREIVERLTAAAELRDEDTGQHISRIGKYTRQISLYLGLPADFVENITVASAMHDIGKIGIPDSILLKPGALTREEFAIIQQHTVIGEKILRGSAHDMLQMGAVIAATHHERWDGSGYPSGLAGSDIPMAGRIAILADQYDALRSQRVYKAALDHATACDIILKGDGRTMPGHFDPQVLAAFDAIKDTFAEIFESSQG